jgi:hypothetical protein
MASTSDLTKSGMLYGTNFSEWKERTTATLRVHGLDRYVHDDMASLFRAGRRVVRATKESSRAASLIIMLVNPEIMTRVPATERSDARQLMHRLEMMSTHFRFLDLPPELRNQIYRLVCANCNRYKLWQLAKKLQHKIQAVGYPTITKISSQIRAEALPIFYASSEFIFDSDRAGTEVARFVRHWMVNVVRDQVQHLHSVSISLDIRVSGRYSVISKEENIQFTHTARDGLCVRYPEHLTDPSKTKLDELIKSTKELANVLGIPNDNRAMLLALITNASLWKSDSLRVSRKR